MNGADLYAQARAHLFRLIGWFVVFFTVCSIGYSVAEWSDKFGGWQANLVWGLFYLIGGLFGLGALMMGVLIYGWVRQYPLAKRDIEEMRDRPSFVVEIHKDVFGPIPWR